MKGRKVIAAGLGLAALAVSAPAQDGDLSLPPETSSPDQTLPAVGLLPEGSNLTGVLIPRYDAERRLTATLRADLMTVLTEEELEALGVRIRMFEPDGSDRAEVTMRSAIYNDLTGILRTDEPVRVTTPTLTAAGSGLVLQTRPETAAAHSNLEGFLLGPVTTSFYTDRRTSMNASPPASLASLALVWVTLNGTLSAAPPVPLTPAELEALETDVVRVETLDTSTETRDLVASGEAHAHTANHAMQAFLGGAAIPVQNREDDAEANETETTETAAGSPGGITVESEGGMYFDAEKGVIVYTKDIRLTEERFTLTCDDQLQVFLAKDEDGGEPATEASGEGSGSILSGTGAGGDLKRIIATGDVRVTSKDADGNDMVASAETAIYDAESGAFILKGGLPEIRRGPSYQRALEPGIYIRYTQEGNFEMSEGKKETFFVLPKN